MHGGLHLNASMLWFPEKITRSGSTQGPSSATPSDEPTPTRAAGRASAPRHSPSARGIRLYRIGLHAALTVISAVCAGVITARDGGWNHPVTASLLTADVLVRMVAYRTFGLFDGVWRYTGPREYAAIAGAVVAPTPVVAALAMTLGALPPSMTFFLLDGLLLVCLLCGVRLLASRPRQKSAPHGRRRVLVIGAGDAGAMIVHDMVYRADSPYDPVGIVDDDRGKHGLRVHGITVLGGRERLEELTRALAPDEVLIAIPSADLPTLRAIVGSLQPFDLPIKTLPNLKELPDCHVELAQIRTLSMEDLLTRPAVGLDHEAVRQLVEGARLLVTGAGGSIGSELCRQLLRRKPSMLVLVERHENALFWLLNELQGLDTANTEIVPALVDVTDEVALEAVLSRTRPHIVFHAAAHKHVPLLEQHVAAAVHNNVVGTWTAARAAERAGVDRFVLISTDKAVAPISVMGASKRLAELIVRVLMSTSRTRFCAVRFGNVLGSNGSVTQVFLRQLRAGGPITVTHPDMRRYFMLISEAVELVQQAAVSASRGAIYVLDMGDPVPIVDLARHLIRLAGYRPDVDIPICFTGLRPGERLTESLFDEDERAVTGPTPGLREAHNDSPTDAVAFESFLIALQRRAASMPGTVTFDDLLYVGDAAPRVEHYHGITA